MSSFIGGDPDNPVISGGSGSVLDPNWEAEFAKWFPGWLEVAQKDSSLMAIFQTFWNEHDPNAGYQTWYDDLLTQIKSSDWYRTQPKSVRDSLIMEAEDPATYEYNLGINEADARQIAFNLGLNFSDSYFSDVAETAERYNWTGQQLMSHISKDGRLASHSPDAPIRGEIKQNHDTLKHYSQSMMADIGGHSWDFAWQIASGDNTLADAKDYIQELSQSYFPFLDVRGLGERGLTIADILAPTKNAIANTLELNPEDVHMWEMPLDQLIKGEGDSQRFLTPMEAVNVFKKDERYQGTTQFRSDVRSLAGAISQTFGRR